VQNEQRENAIAAVEASAIYCINPKSRDLMREAAHTRKDTAIIEVYHKRIVQP